MPVSCPSLDVLSVENAPITALDVSNYRDLRRLYLHGTEITSVDVSHNSKLEILYLYDTPLTEIDLTHNPELFELWVPKYTAPGKITSLDTSGNPKLKTLIAEGNAFTSLDFSSNPALEFVRVQSCPNIESVSFGQHPNLQTLVLDCSKINQIDLSGMPGLKHLQLEDGKFAQVDLSVLPELEYLDLSFPTRLKSLDVSHNPKLTSLRCDGAPLITSIDISVLPLLEDLTVEANSLTSLDLTHNPELKSLMCYWNPIGELDLSKNTKLEYLEAGGCNYPCLNLSNCVKKPELGSYSGGNVTYVSTSGGTFDLSTLPGFDVSRASGWTGGTVKGTVLTFLEDDVAYQYDCGKGVSLWFTLRKGNTLENDSFRYILEENGTATITKCKISGAVKIPSEIDGHTVIRLGNNAFSNVSGVTSVTIPSSVQYLGNDPGNLLAYVFSDCPDLKAINVASDSESFLSEDGVLFSNDKSVLYRYPPKKAGSEYRVPAETTHIDCSAFEDVKGTVDVYLENRDTNWAMFAFVRLENMTVYYRPGGRSEERAKQSAEDGLAGGGYCPNYVMYGEEYTGKTYNEVADDVIREVITDSMDAGQKALALHDWIVSHAHYTMRYDDPTGILLYGEGLCESYAKTYKLLLDKVGITNTLQTGRAGEAHMWNRVKIGNIWYHVDCTWDDPVFNDGTPQEAVSGIEHHGYFMVSPQRISQDHWWEDMDLETSGWRKEADGMIFLDTDGNQVKGWLEIDGGRFWFDENGVSVSGKTVIDGKTYNFRDTVIYTRDGMDYTAGTLADLPEFTDPMSLPARVKAVGEEAFAGLSVQAVIVPDNCTSVGPRAFADCPNLVYVSIPAGCAVDDTAFEGCGSVYVDVR